MARPKHKEFDLKEGVAKLIAAGFTPDSTNLERDAHKADDDLILQPLPQRIQIMLGIIKHEPIKATTMNYLILYDIEKNKVRALIAKYLLSQGCIRVQKSVFLSHSNHKRFDAIKNTLAEINEIYENSDSIILIPLNVSDARSMKLIGKNVNIEQIIDPPNTVFI